MLNIYRSPEGEAAIHALYDRQLAQLGIETESRMVSTRFGLTHVLVAGLDDAIEHADHFGPVRIETHPETGFIKGDGVALGICVEVGSQIVGDGGIAVWVVMTSLGLVDVGCGVFAPQADSSMAKIAQENKVEFFIGRNPVESDKHRRL